MRESYDNAKEELKRADHLIYVSLKYTRTVDVIKSIVERLINAFDFGTEALLKHAKSQKKISEIPTIPRVRAETAKKLFPDIAMQQFIEFYHVLRKIDKAHFDRAQEFRRHVTMTAHIDNDHVEITIDIINDYFEKTKEFVLYVGKVLEGGEEE